VSTAPTKAIVAAVTGVLSGAGFIVTSGLLHGATLTVVQACIVTADVVLSTLGVYVTVNKPQPPTPPE
jgi:hypothetical protein